MNPFYVPAIILGTASALVLKAYDDGKTSSRTSLAAPEKKPPLRARAGLRV